MNAWVSTNHSKIELWNQLLLPQPLQPWAGSHLNRICEGDRDLGSGRGGPGRQVGDTDPLTVPGRPALDASVLARLTENTEDLVKKIIEGRMDNLIEGAAARNLYAEGFYFSLLCLSLLCFAKRLTDI